MFRLNRKGFTLVEIMIVVAIIALLAAIAIPNIVRARLNANEGAAMSNLRTIATAAESFRAVQTPPDYPVDVDALSGATPPYIPSSFGEYADATDVVQGYRYGITRLGATASGRTYIVSCWPDNVGTSGNRRFAIDSTGELRADTGTAAEVTTQAVYDAMTAVAGF